MSQILLEKISDCKTYLNNCNFYDKSDILLFITSTVDLFELNDCVKFNTNDEFEEYISLEHLYDSLRYKLEKEMSADKDKIIKQLSEQVKNLESKIHINLIQNQTNNQSQDVKLSISLEQTIDVVQSIHKSILSEDEKDILIGKLSSFGRLAAANEKDKDKIWDKAKGILSWIADKGTDAGIALLPTIPFVMQVMQG